MDELLRTTDVVLISHVTIILGEADIDVLALDEHMSVLEGSISILIPKRLMVPTHQLNQAVRILIASDLRDTLSAKVLKAAGYSAPGRP